MRMRKSFEVVCFRRRYYIRQRWCDSFEELSADLIDSIPRPSRRVPG